MGLPINGVVGQPTSPMSTGQETSPRLGRFGEVITLDWVTEAVRRGYGFVYSSALAGQELIVAGTANAPFIWNPSDSNVDLILLSFRAKRTAVATPLEGGFTYLREAYSLGANIGTGAPVVSGTAVAAKNLLGPVAGKTSAVRFYPTTVVCTSGAMLFHSVVGFAQTADDGATTVSGPHTEQLIDELNGRMIIPPGGGIAVGFSVSSSTTYATSFLGLEIPRT